MTEAVFFRVIKSGLAILHIYFCVACYIVLERSLTGLDRRGIFRIYYPFPLWFSFSMTVSFFCVVENAV